MYRNFIAPGISRETWKSALPALPPVVKAEKACAPAGKVELIASLGLGVSGGMQICLNHEFRGAAVWIAASVAERQALRKLLVKPSIAIVPYLLDEKTLARFGGQRGTPAWRKARHVFFAKHGLDPDVPTFYFSGRITPSKGVHHLVRLANQQRFPIQLILAGLREKTERFPGEEVEAWKSLFHSRFCKTVHLGRVGRLANYRYLTFADSCLALSTDGGEDFGLFPRQSLAVGTPTLIASWGGLRDIRLPRGLDKRMLRRFTVRKDRHGVYVPDLSDLRLASYFSGISCIRTEERCEGAGNFLRQNRREVVDGLKAALALRRLATPVRFTNFSRELVLAIAKKGVLDATLAFPRDLQFSIMTGHDSKRPNSL